MSINLGNFDTTKKRVDGFDMNKILEFIVFCAILVGHGKVAQLVEQFAFNELVAGSNPALPTKKIIKKPIDISIK